MEDDKKTTELNEDVIAENSSRQELEALLNDILPEEKKTGNVEQMALDFIRKQIAANNRLTEAIGDDPRMAQVFAEIMNGGKGAVSLVRYFGKDFLNAEEGSPEYEELMAADKALLEEREQSAARQKDFDNNVVAWFDALEAYLEKKGLDKEKYLAEIEDMVVIPALDLVIDDKLFARLVKAVDYDKDVEDAFEAGNINGRNMNINELRAKPSDGMPKGLGSAATMVERPKVRRNSLVEKAMGA